MTEEGFNPEFLTLLTNLAPTIYVTLVWVNNSSLGHSAQQDKFLDYLLEHSPFRGVKAIPNGALNSHFIHSLLRIQHITFNIKNEKLEIQLAVAPGRGFPNNILIIFLHPDKGELYYQWTYHASRAPKSIVMDRGFRDLQGRGGHFVDLSTRPSLFFDSIYDLLADFESGRSPSVFPPWNGPDTNKIKF